MAESKLDKESSHAMLERLLKRCSQCQEWKARSDFHRNSRTKDGLQPACKVCKNWASHRQWLRDREKLSQQKRVWNEKNTLRLKPVKKLYRQVNREAVRTRNLNNGGSYTSEQWNALCEKYGNCCLWCDSKGPLTVDHVVPLSRGGSNGIENLQPLCAHCNKVKRDRVMDFRPFHEAV